MIPSFVRRAVVGVLALGVAASVVLVVHNLRISDQLIHPPRAHVSVEESARVHREIPGLEDVSLHTLDGLTLRGWFAPGARRAAVVLVHGGWGNRLQLLPDARVLLAHGFGILVYDSRGAGESDGELQSWGDKEQRDVFAALDFLSARPDVDPKRIAALGFSIGASTVALAAAHDPRPRAVILYATWTSLEDEMRAGRSKYGPFSFLPTLYVLRRAGVDVDAVRPVDHVRAIAPRPLLMIAGTLDDNTPVSVMQTVFAAAGEPKDLWVEPGAGHGGYVTAQPAEYETRVVGFLDRALR